MGVGHLNANRAFKQFAPGEYEANDADVPLIGWDYGTTEGTTFGDINSYSIEEDLFGDSFISITLAWDRAVGFQAGTNDLNSDGDFDAGENFADYTQTGFDPQADSVINDLRLWLLPESAATTASAIASSDFNEGTVEHIFFQIPETGRYKIWVEQTDDDVSSGQDYAVAWWAAGVPSNAIGGDFNEDGMVDAADLTQWKDDFGVNPDSDADNDGDSDGADFLAWQRNFGTSVPVFPNAATVPEPSALILGAMSFALITCRRSTRLRQVA